MIIKDESQPYPYLPGYTGTYEDRHRALQLRLKRLQKDLQTLKAKYEQDRNNMSLLYDLSCCQAIVRQLLD